MLEERRLKHGALTRWAAHAVSLVVLGLASGCGGSTAPTGSVAGSVTVDGKPLTRGFVTLANFSTGISLSVDLDGAGAFRTPQIPIGTYRVGFDSAVPPPESDSRHEKLPIPDRYRFPASSGLECEVQKGDNTVTFELDRDASEGRAT